MSYQFLTAELDTPAPYRRSMLIGLIRVLVVELVRSSRKGERMLDACRGVSLTPIR